MGFSFNIDTNNENEFNQQLQMYLAQGFSMQSNFNGTAILKKKSYSMGLLIVLIIFFFPAAIIYYLVASDDIVTITLNGGQASGTNFGAASQSVSYDEYCEECGHGLFKDSKFCPGCGRDLSKVEEESVEEVSVQTDSVEEESVEEVSVQNDSVEEESVEEVAEENETVEEETLKCESCGTELGKDNLFCPNCGEAVKK